MITLFLTTLTTLYTLLVISWFVLHTLLGDRPWWLALINIFAPHLFLPLLLLLPLALLAQRRIAMMSLIPPLLLFVWLYGNLFIPMPPTATAAEGGPIADDAFTVMTFNVHARSHSKETARVILENGLPDLVAIQELRSGMARILAEELGEHYPYQVYDTVYWRNGTGILSRYPLTELTIDHLYSNEWELQIVEAEINGQTVTIYNVHPASTNISRYLNRYYRPIDGIKNSIRVREWNIGRLLKDAQTRTGPVLILGDFNTTDQSDAYAHLSTQFEDAHRAAGWGFGHTFPAYSGSYRHIPIFPRQVRIDMIFYSADFQAVDSWVSDVYGESDHLPVLARLRWRN